MPDSQQEAPPILNWIRIISGPGFIIGGISLMVFLFWPGVALAYIGCFLLLNELIYEPLLLRKNPLAQLLCLALFFAAVGVGTARYVFVFSQPIFSMDSWATDFPVGFEVGGIKWESAYTEVVVSVENGTSRDYTDIDLYIQPLNTVAKAGQIGTFPPCTITYTAGGQEVAPVLVKDTNGKTSVIQIYHQGGNSPWRLRCDKLPKHSTVKIVFAVVNLGRPAKILIPDSIFINGTWLVLATPNNTNGKIDMTRFKPTPHVL